MSSALAISTENVSRVYQTYLKPEGIWGSLKGFWNRQHQEKIALHPTTLQIERGQIVGLVGANGAGKTTLIKLLSGLVSPTSGRATVLGFDPSLRSSAYLRQMSVLLGQKNQLWWDLTPSDSFSLLAEIYDLDSSKAKQRVYELAELLMCRHVLSTQLRRLSLGERMKMEMIGALLHQPQVLFLDEPTIGLDIVAQTNLRHFLQEYVKKNSPTVILTSHYMDDIAKLADRLLLLSQGKLVYDGTVGAFSAQHSSKKILRFSLSEPLEKNLIISHDHCLPAHEQNFALSVGDKELASVLSAITGLGGVTGIQIEERDFEDVIHEFLAKEPGVLSTGDSKST